MAKYVHDDYAYASEPMHGSIEHCAAEPSPSKAEPSTSGNQPLAAEQLVKPQAVAFVDEDGFLDEEYGKECLDHRIQLWLHGAISMDDVL